VKTRDDGTELLLEGQRRTWLLLLITHVTRRVIHSDAHVTWLLLVIT